MSAIDEFGMAISSIAIIFGMIIAIINPLYGTILAVVGIGVFSISLIFYLGTK